MKLGTLVVGGLILWGIVGTIAAAAVAREVMGKSGPIKKFVSDPWFTARQWGGIPDDSKDWRKEE